MVRNRAVAGVAWTGGFLKCYAGALMNAALAFIVARPNMTTEAVSAFISAGVAAHITCSFLTGFLSDWIGRRRTTLISAVLPLLSVSVLCVFAYGMRFSPVTGRGANGCRPLAK